MAEIEPLKIGDFAGFVDRSAPEPLPAPGLTDEADWFAAYVDAGAELSVAAVIRALGLVVYVPMAARIVRRPPKFRAVRSVMPAFPRYVFFESFAELRCWQAVREIDGVVGIVSNDQCPMRIRAEEIGDMRAAEDMGMFDETRRPDKAEVIAGDVVSFVGGMYQGYEATVKSVMKGKATVTVVGKGGVREVKARVDLLRILA